MAEFICRAKTVRDGKWVEGYYVQLNDALVWSCMHDYILTGRFEVNLHHGGENIERYQIRRCTLGRCTGREDKNGQRIFERDIVRARLEEGTRAGFEWPLMRIEFINAAFTLVDKLGRAFCTMAALAPNVELEVLGNVHDNPELIGGDSE